MGALWLIPCALVLLGIVLFVVGPARASRERLMGPLAAVWWWMGALMSIGAAVVVALTLAVATCAGKG